MSIRKKYYLLFGLVSLIYITITLSAPLAPNRFNLTVAKTHLIQVTIALPIIAIWAVAIYGVERFKNYVLSIQRHPDGQALDKIAIGLTILVSSLIVNAIYGAFRPWALRDGWLEAFTITGNYLGMLLPLVAYSYLYLGAQNLKQLAIKEKDGRSDRLAIGLLMLLIGAVYAKTIFGYKYRTATPDANSYTSFYLPDVLILFGLIVPYLIGWGLGIKASYDLLAYQRKVKGTIYKSALLKLVTGLLAVVFFSVLLQMLIAFSTYFAKAKLASILIIVYLIIILYGLGFAIIAAGCRKLRAIEEVK